MNTPNQARMLAFNLESNALRALEALCAALAVDLNPVPQEAFALPLGALAGIPAAPKAASAPKPFSDPMLVMCNLDEPRFNAFLQMLRASGLPPIPLKAVLTPTNATWSACQLHDELAREHEALRRRRP